MESVQDFIRGTGKYHGSPRYGEGETHDSQQTLNEFHFTTEDAEDTEDFIFSSVPSVSSVVKRIKNVQEWIYFKNVIAPNHSP